MRSKSRLHAGNAGLGLDHMSAGDKLAPAMIPEIDIWRAASLMLKRYGEKAPRKAPRAPMSFSPTDPLRQKRAHAQRPASRADRRLDRISSELPPWHACGDVTDNTVVNVLVPGGDNKHAITNTP
jgi:hypothetical protein